MKTILGTIILLFVFMGSSLAQDTKVENCLHKQGSDVQFKKDWKVNFKVGTKNNIPTASYRILLIKNETYRFSVCNSMDYEGEAIIELYDDSRKLISSMYKGKNMGGFDFPCPKTASFTVKIYFKDGKKGKAIGIMSTVKKDMISKK